MCKEPGAIGMPSCEEQNSGSKRAMSRVLPQPLRVLGP